MAEFWFCAEVITNLLLAIIREQIDREATHTMQHVSSLGGPRILLPTHQVKRWVEALGDHQNPAEGVYGLACSVDDYVGIIGPWETPILVFGDEPTDIYWSPNQAGGLFIRWVAANSLEQLVEFAKSVAETGNWTECIEWNAEFTDYTLMDAVGDFSTMGVEVQLATGKYCVESQYAESNSTATIVQRLRRIG